MATSGRALVDSVMPVWIHRPGGSSGAGVRRTERNIAESRTRQEQDPDSLS